MRLAGFGAETHHFFRLTQCRHRERQRVLRHGIEGREMAFAVLLFSAAVIELHNFHNLRIIEIRHGGVIKSDVPILAHA